MGAQEHSGHAAPRAGHVRFPTSCAPAAQGHFVQGVALLHSFWYEESASAFRAAAAADTGCAMAQWGVAMTYLHPLWAAPTAADLAAGSAAVARARALGPRDARERGWIEAAGAFFDSAATKPHGARLRAWEQALGRLHAGEPADSEAAIDHALALIATQSKTDTSYAQLRRAADILEPLFAIHPDHPGLAHYLIHAYDAPALVDRARLAADRYATIAPSVPHAQHMPSHSYSLLGMWTQSIAANRRAAAAARRFEVEQRMTEVWDQRLHAMDYLAYAYLQLGRRRDAMAVLRDAAAMDRVQPGTVSEFALAAIPARYALERGDWAAAARLDTRPATIPLVRAVGAFTRALGAARTGDTAKARAEVATLGELETAAAGQSDPFAPSMIRVNRLVAESWLLLAAADTAGALRIARQAAETEEGALKNPLTPGPLLSARELEGEMLLMTGRRSDAAAALRTALANTPGRARGVALLRLASR